jgi:hypothetical protein
MAADRYNLQTLTVLINDIRESQHEIEKRLEVIEENTIRNSQSNTDLQDMVLDIIERHEAHVAEEQKEEEKKYAERLLLAQREKSKFFIFLKENENIMKIIFMGIVALIVLFRVNTGILLDLLKSW